MYGKRDAHATETRTITRSSGQQARRVETKRQIEVSEVVNPDRVGGRDAPANAKTSLLPLSSKLHSGRFRALALLASRSASRPHLASDDPGQQCQGFMRTAGREPRIAPVAVTKLQ